VDDHEKSRSSTPLPINVIESAAACGHIDEIPVAEITIDGIRRVFAGVARVATDDPAGIACRLTPVGTRQAFHRCDIRAGTTTTASLPLEVRIDGVGPIGSERVEITGEPGSFLVDLGARPRRPTLVRIGVAPQPLKVVRTDKYP